MKVGRQPFTIDCSLWIMYLHNRSLTVVTRGRFFKGTDKTWVALGPSRTQKVWKFSNKRNFFLIVNFQTFWVLLGPSATWAKSVLLKNRPLDLTVANKRGHLSEACLILTSATSLLWATWLWLICSTQNPDLLHSYFNPLCGQKLASSLLFFCYTRHFLRIIEFSKHS